MVFTYEFARLPLWQQTADLVARVVVTRESFPPKQACDVGVLGVATVLHRHARVDGCVLASVFNIPLQLQKDRRFDPVCWHIEVQQQLASTSTLGEVEANIASDNRRVDIKY